MSIRRLSSELFLIALIHLIFFFPFIIGFTLYFVVLHSIRNESEYLFFKSEDSSFGLVEFLKLLLPYSLLSIFFTSVLLALSHLGYLGISIPFLSIIIISVITLPHAIVMHIFTINKGLFVQVSINFSSFLSLVPPQCSITSPSL